MIHSELFSHNIKINMRKEISLMFYFCSTLTPIRDNGHNGHTPSCHSICWLSELYHYLSLTLDGLQGSLVSLLFCFGNNEVLLSFVPMFLILLELFLFAFVHINNTNCVYHTLTCDTTMASMVH